MNQETFKRPLAARTTISGKLLGYNFSFFGASTGKENTAQPKRQHSRDKDFLTFYFWTNSACFFFSSYEIQKSKKFGRFALFKMFLIYFFHMHLVFFPIIH